MRLERNAQRGRGQAALHDAHVVVLRAAVSALAERVSELAITNVAPGRQRHVLCADRLPGRAAPCMSVRALCCHWHALSTTPKL